MNILKPWFISRLLREKVLVLALVLVGALIWLSSASKHLSANLRSYRLAEASLAEQGLWLGNREAIEEAAKAAAANLDASKTYNATYLVAEIMGMAKRSGLAVNTEPPRTQRSPQFAIHTVQVTTRRAELPAVLRFYQELSSKAPYLGLEQVSVQGDRSAPGMVNVNLQIASVELLSEANNK
ncbi:MAG: general secretion pathway protein GspM [Burkholderiales bacterium]|nr:general secretion pathway protein GspM [Opitutaceae bacterium]